MAGLGSKEKPFGEGIGQAIQKVVWGGACGVHIELTISTATADFDSGIGALIDVLNSETGTRGIVKDSAKTSEGAQGLKSWSYEFEIKDIEKAHEEADPPGKLTLDSEGKKFAIFYVNANWVQDQSNFNATMTWKVWSKRVKKDGNGVYQFVGNIVHEVKQTAPVPVSGSVDLIVQAFGLRTGKFLAFLENN